MAEDFDHNLIRYVSGRNDLSLRLEDEVSNRRGAKMLTLSAAGERFGLKVATDHGSSVAREGGVLRELGDFTRHYVDSGSYEGISWLLLSWLGGESVYRRVRHLYGDPKTEVQPKLLSLFASMFLKVAELHALGYLHGDLQPDHFRVDGGVHLLDFALTHHRDEAFHYPGALVHFSAPEVCEQQLSGRSPVYDELAELYSLASVVFFFYTGQVSADYGGEGMRLSLEGKRERIAQEYRNTFCGADCEPFSALEHVLEKCLTVDKRERYAGVAQAARALPTLRSSYA